MSTPGAYSINRPYLSHCNLLDEQALYLPPSPPAIPLFKIYFCLFVPMYIQDKLFMPYLIVPMSGKRVSPLCQKIDCILVFMAGMSLVGKIQRKPFFLWGAPHKNSASFQNSWCLLASFKTDDQVFWFFRFFFFAKELERSCYRRQCQVLIPLDCA